MNTKKHKNKNRNKHPNPVPPQKIEIVKQEDKVESEVTTGISVSDERVPQITSENLATHNPENIKEADTIPKKPKRHRGKKKKQDKEIHESILTDQPETNMEITDKCEEKVELITESKESSVIPIIHENKPCVTKPVIKQSKDVTNLQLETSIPLAVSAEDDSNVVDSKEKESVEQEIKEFKSKKKNKKKKHRLDSEKSDKTETASSANELDDLLQTNCEHEKQDEKSEEGIKTTENTAKKERVELDNSSKQIIENVKKVAECQLSVPNIQDNFTRDSKNNKKKSKKGKKQHIIEPNSEAETSKNKECDIEHEVIKASKQEVDNIPNIDILSDTIPSVKCIEEDQSENVQCEASSSSNSENIAANISAEILPLLEGTIIDSQKIDENNNNDNNTLLLHETERNISSTFPASVVGQLDAKDKETSLQTFVGTDLLPTLNLKEIESPLQPDTASLNLGSNVEYPRSSSEQIIDNNNNMLVQEIFATNEAQINLNTSACVYTPRGILDLPSNTVFGNIYAPEEQVKPLSEIFEKVEESNDSYIKKIDKSKTDLKSRVVEVNLEMEGLKLSIEKSLAGLTALEKTEEELDQGFKYKPETLEIKEVPQEDNSIKIEKSTEVINTEYDKLEGTSKGDNPSLLAPLDVIPVCPARKDKKGRGKGKKKTNQNISQDVSSSVSSSVFAAGSEKSNQDTKTETIRDEKSDQKIESSKENTKQQSNVTENKVLDENELKSEKIQSGLESIDDFQDALSSSIDDINNTFDVIVNELDIKVEKPCDQPAINTISTKEDKEKDKEQDRVHPVSQPKNLLGHHDIPVQSNKTDYKKEKHKIPNNISAKVKIKDSVEIANEANKKQSKQSQTDQKHKFVNQRPVNETISCITNGNEEYVYKYSFRKVFLASACHICKKQLQQSRVTCSYCNLVPYCCKKHKDEDWPQHQALCFAVSTICHLKEQKYIYAGAKNITGHDYRLFRMQMIVSCEKVLKRKLVPWEQEALLYPRMCADVSCREWRQSKLKDCDGCWQISYCLEQPEHLPKQHQRWCKSYSLYQKLVCFQQTKGRLEPKLPTRVMMQLYKIPEKLNEVLAALYEEKIDMNDIQYAALTQIATAPLTAAYSYQLFNNNSNIAAKTNGLSKNQIFVLHVVGAELQFEADTLGKWELFFLHLYHRVQDLRIVFVGLELNPSNLPLDILGNTKVCENCRQRKRKVMFEFQDKKSYVDYFNSDDYLLPDLVCAFNPSIQRSSSHNGNDPWPTTLSCILKQKQPFLLTSYTIEELKRDLMRIQECVGDYEVKYKVLTEPKHNAFASVRPDRNFISDDEMPLLFKNYCFMIICGDF